MKGLHLLLVLLLGMQVLGPVTAGIVTITSPSPGNPDALWPGWNVIAMPGIPLDPNPPSVFGELPIDNVLCRWSNLDQSWKFYDPWSPQEFGNVLLTEGYYYYYQPGGPTQISYSGLNDADTMDVWVSLPKTGWHLIGNPFNHSYQWPGTKLTDGNVTVSLETAARTPGYEWLDSIGWWWEASSQSLKTIGLEDDFPDTTQMEHWHGYWVQTRVDKIAMIFQQ